MFPSVIKRYLARLYRVKIIKKEIPNILSVNLVKSYFVDAQVDQTPCHLQIHP